MATHTSRTDRRLLARLYQDLAELRDSPYPGVAVFTDDADLRKLCLVLTPPSGPWKDLALHFDVFLPEKWPAKPPAVATTVHGIDHPNLFGSYICCDLLKTQEQIYAESGYTGGYTPALTLRGLFLQFLTFFSNTSVEQDGGYVYYIGDYVTTAYVWDNGSPISKFPQKSGCSHTHSCTCVRGFPAMEELWRNSASPEVPVNGVLPQGVYNRTTKDVQGRKMHRVQQLNKKWSSTLKLISSWNCQKCPYGSSRLPHHNIGVSTELGGVSVPKRLRTPPKTCGLDKVSDDCLHEIANVLSSETIISFGSAYPRFHNIVTSFHLLLRRELRCFFLRTPLNACILGIGISLDSGARTLGSDFDWISMDAFESYNVRLSIEKRSFEYFLPLAFNRANFVRVVPEIRRRLYTIDLGLREAEAVVARRSRRPSNRRTGPPAKPYNTVEVIYRMMNTIVVSLMKSCDDTMSTGGSKGQNQTLLFASEKAVTSYCLLLHLLMCLCRSQPEILSDATVRLRRFIDIPKTRYKDQTPDLGELIVIITLVLIMPPTDKSRPMTWDTIRGKFLEEAVTRNVRWVLQDSPELEVMELGASDYRLNTTFKNSRTSLRLIMFQVTFLNVFLQTYGGDIARLDDNYGFAEKEIAEGMVKEIKDIYKVNTWPQFFVRVKTGKLLGKETFSQMLRDTVQESARRGYHRRSPQSKLDNLKSVRLAIAKAEAAKAKAAPI